MEVDYRISGKTKILGIIGNPIEHTISPLIHNSISKYLNVDVTYIPFRVEKAGLEAAVKGLKALNIVGVNVTIPYKKDIMKFLDENSKEAILMGAVNTVKNIDGRLYGYNTDAEGFARSFKEEAGTGFKKKKVVLIGAGGAARAMAVKIAKEGAEEINIINRTISKASDITEIINNNIENVAYAYSSEDVMVKDIIKQSDIIINATSIGMYPDINKSPMYKKNEFSSNNIVYDAIYTPSKTKFLRAAEKKGCKIINGLGMLFYQAIFSYEIWTGIKLNENLIKEIRDSFAEVSNK